jgi:hypothetical protein
MQLSSTFIRLFFGFSVFTVSFYFISFPAPVDTESMDFIHEQISSSSKYRLVGTYNTEPINFSTALAHLSDPNSILLDKLIHILREQPFRAYFFECPPVCRHTATLKPFEFVLIPAPQLEDLDTDTLPFKQHFDANNNCMVAVFRSLGKDALLVSPCPLPSTPIAGYAHLASFVRSATDRQTKELFASAASEMLSLLGDAKLWLSTSGLGVSYLHVRLDSVPKYYNWQEYKLA